MSAVAVVMVWLALGFLLYVYVGFPFLLVAVGFLRKRHVAKQSVTPRLTLIVAAHNEAQHLAACIESALAAEYPRAALEIIVASDGSTDATAEIVERYASQGVRLLRLPRAGKIAALNEAVPHATGEVLVFTDANVTIERAALRALARNFADAAVGGVAACTGYHVETGSESSSRGEKLYWRYDTWLKELESATGSVVSAHGGLYAIRRTLYSTPADHAVTDDFIISTAVVQKGFRLVFEREARAWEYAVPAARPEFQRRVRLMTRGLRAVAQRRALLNPFRYGFYSVTLTTHKILRRLTPLALLILLAASAFASATGSLYMALFAAQFLFYALAVIGFLARGSATGQRRLFYVPFYYCLANSANLFALWNFMRGERIVAWQPQRHAQHA